MADTMTNTDQNGPYTPGTYQGHPIHTYGQRGTWVYFAYADDLSWVTKVPASWVTA